MSKQINNFPQPSFSFDSDSNVGFFYNGPKLSFTLEEIEGLLKEASANPRECYE